MNPILDLSQQLKYVIMPGKFAPGFSATTLHNKTYQLWREVWKDVFTEAGNPTALVADDYLRQDFICAIHNDREVIACHLYTLFNLDQNVSFDHRYFSIFPSEVMEIFKERSANYLMSMEFLTVHPEWRRNSTLGVPLGPVLIQLGINVLQSIAADSAIAPARKKTKVDQTAYKFGFECLKPNVTRGNLDCDLIALFPRSIKTYPDENVVLLAESLWEKRQDLTGRLNANDLKLDAKVA